MPCAVCVGRQACLILALGALASGIGTLGSAARVYMVLHVLVPLRLRSCLLYPRRLIGLVRCFAQSCCL